MEITDIINNDKYLTEYIKICNEEWGSPKSTREWNKYLKEKKQKIQNKEKVIKILGLVDNNTLIGFISLLKEDGENRKDLTPWYATMFVKKEYRKNGYSKLLNNAMLEEAKKLEYQKVYLKTCLNNYYEKFGAIFIEHLDNGEKLYYIQLS